MILCKNITSFIGVVDNDFCYFAIWTICSLYLVIILLAIKEPPPK